MDLEKGTVGVKIMIAAISLAWVAGTGVAVFAANVENDVEQLKEKISSMKKQDEVLSNAAKDLSKLVQELNTSVKLLDQRIEFENDRRERREREANE